MRKLIARLIWAITTASLLACDPSVFDYRIARPGELDAGAVSQSKSQDSPGKDNTQTAQSAMTASIHRPPDAAAAMDAGMLTFGTVGSADSPTDAGAAAMRDDAGAAHSRDASNDADAGEQHAAANGGGCPRLPSDADESFCYDFEDGVNGPRAGETYDLWTTPQLPIANQLTLAADPGQPQNHVLQTKPSLTASEASAALSHSTQPFGRATVEFDIWVNESLQEASADVSWFRYVPMDGDDEHVIALIFRRGEALLRAENREEQTLSALPRSAATPSHVSVLLDRRGPCRTEILLDGVRVASQSQGTCTPDTTGFVEFGLVMHDRSSGELSAYYDNVAFTRW